MLFDLLLLNKSISNLYFKLKSEEPYSIISVYENRIRYDLINIFNKLKLKISQENFYIEKSKNLLSFYERNKNKLVNDNLYYLAILYIISFEKF